MKSLNEFYQTYDQYKKSKMIWGTPSDLKKDAISTITRISPGLNIDSITDESTDNGIKFKLHIGNDIIHMFKIDSERFKWEYYLNKKKINDKELAKYILNSHGNTIEEFLQSLTKYDIATDYINNSKQEQLALQRNKEIENKFKELSIHDKHEVLNKIPKLYKSTKYLEIFSKLI